jgi:general secretion pathway protein D
MTKLLPPTTPTPRSRATHHAARGLGVALALALVGAASSAAAQTSPRTGPVLRTPPKNAPGTRPGADPNAANPGTKPGDAKDAKAGQGGPNAGQGGPGDPMAKVKTQPPEIEYKPIPANTKVKFNLNDAELYDVANAIAAATGRRFIYGAKLRQIKATVITPEDITAAEAYAAFLSILETNGMTVVPHGRFLKIVETPGVVSQATPVYGQANPVPDEDRFITRLYRLTHVDAQEATGVLTKFKSKDGDISSYAPGNLLIITDTGSNIRRILRIIEEIDVGGAGDQLWVEPVHYSSASEIANKLNEIFDLKGGKGGRARIVADDRTNSLVLTANNADYVRMLELIKRLDVSQTGTGEIHVLPLQHAVCKDLQGTLNQVLGRGGVAGSTPAAGGRTPTASRTPTTTPGAAPGAAGASDIFEGNIKLACDDKTNKLVITASLRDYAQLRTVIDELDVPRRQVFIEAVIMDVNVDRVTDLGVAYHGGAPLDFDGQQGVFYGGNNPGQSILGVPANLEALALGVRGPTIEGTSNLFGTGISIPALGVVLHALAKDGDTNVLATPHILATDNEEAEISIGQNIPLQTNLGGLGSLGGLAGAAGAAGLGGLGLGFGGFQAPRQDVGTKITVKPYVNDSDNVRLDLTEEISDAGAAVGALGAIPINKRTARTTLIVRDQQTVVIGGLMRDTIVNAQTKIPILGDIPILGALFRQSKKTTTKTNLLLVLTPYVIRDQSDLRAIFERKMQERQEFIDRYFVFNDSHAWEPPKDFTRTNGLVEDVRQSLLAQDERRRIEEATRPKGKLLHTPGEPIELPSIGVIKQQSSTPASPATPATPAAGQRPTTRPATTTRPARAPARTE